MADNAWLSRRKPGINEPLSTPKKSFEIHGAQTAPLAVFSTIDIDQSRLGKRLTHFVHVEAQRAGLELLALAILIVLALLRFLGSLGGEFVRNYNDTIVIGDHNIAGFH